MKKNPLFGQVLEDADQLSVEEQETLIEAIRRRLTHRRRKEIVQEIRDAEQEFEQGKATPITPEALMKEILS